MYPCAGWLVPCLRPRAAATVKHAHHSTQPGTSNCDEATDNYGMSLTSTSTGQPAPLGGSVGQPCKSAVR